MSSDPSVPAVSSAAINLRRLVMLRALVSACEVAVLGVVAGVLNLDLPVAALLVVIGAHLFVNVLTAWRLRGPRPVSERELYFHLVFDVAVLTVLLYLSGGSSNPFAFLFLLPLAITAAALPGLYTWTMAVLTCACYSLLLVFNVPFSSHAHDMRLHVWGMWSGFMLSAGLIAYFVVKMGAALREHERRLAQSREQALRDERLLALGTLAAGAAHELGTPLATMSVLAGELQRECVPGSPSGEQVAVLRTQIARCKEVLAGIAASAGEVPAEAGGRRRVRDYLDDVMAEWRRARADVMFECEWRGDPRGPWIVAERTLTHALHNVLNNAADASPGDVRVRGQWDNRALRVEVIDRGPGFSEEAVARAGNAPFTTKGEGHGLGLLLAHATVTRYGGELSLANRDGGGGCVRIDLPLEKLLVELVS